MLSDLFASGAVPAFRGGHRRKLGAWVIAALLALLAALPLRAQPASAALPVGFTEVTAFGGLTQPTAVKFASDGRIFVAEKSGLIKVFDSLSDTTPTTFADLRTSVHNFWDRGLLGLALHPNFPATPQVFVLYTHDAAIGGTAPRWGTAGATSDPCPTPPGATTDGCVVSGRLSKLTASGNTATSEQVLIEDWCQQYPSHSIGALEFGTDGMLYASGGDGASFTFTDYGQGGSPVNPCGDPPGGPGTALTPPTAEGGSLRSQDLRTSGDPVGLDGSVIRIDPNTGAGAPGNPLASSANANARRIVAQGFRNPFRIVKRPGTNEIYVGDVGANTWEEIDRIATPADTTVDNFGWPCYEGPDRMGAFDAANLNICENLYAAGTGAVGAPVFSYRHDASVVAGDNCRIGSSSIAGLSFEFYTGTVYPVEYQGALFFADYSRDCIWVMPKGGNNLPNPAARRAFVSPAANPVNLEMGPTGELFYPDFDGGTIRRIRFVGTGACSAEQFKAEYFTGITPGTTPAFTQCENDIQHHWGPGGPGNGLPNDNFSARWTGSPTFAAAGTYEFKTTSDDGIRLWVDGQLLIDNWVDQAATTKLATKALSVGAHAVKVEYYEHAGNAVAQVSWALSTNGAPTAVIDTPAAGTTWKVSDTIAFTGHATDPQEGTLPASALTWSLELQHCPTNCHSHFLQTFSGVSGGSFSAPDHDYPSYLQLKLTAKDSSGMTHTAVRRLDPKTVQLTFNSNPQGAEVTVGTTPGTTPFTRTVIVGSRNSVSATTPQTLAGTTYTFASWSDGGAQTHTIVAPASASRYTATYTTSSTFQSYANVNFQPATAPAVSGYLIDSGLSFGARNGFTYGWNTSNPTARDRDATSSPDQRYDTLIHMQRGGTWTWEMAVPNGTYRVRAVSGDPSYLDSVHRIAVEGTLTVNHTPTSSARWGEGTAVVNVTDGRLTISNAAGSVNNKLNFLVIDRKV
jgi:glucose/arabinose dehydrogenase